MLLLLEQRRQNLSPSSEGQSTKPKFTEAKKERPMKQDKRISKPSRKALDAGARAMAPSAVLHLKAWNGRNATAAEWELIERRETNKPKLGIKR
jgi:hypothetical protein